MLPIMAEPRLDEPMLRPSVFHEFSTCLAFLSVFASVEAIWIELRQPPSALMRSAAPVGLINKQTNKQGIMLARAQV